MALSLGTKQMERRADHYAPCNAEVENEWRYTSALTCANTVHTEAGLPLPLPLFS